MNVKQTTLRRDLQRQSCFCPVLWVEVGDDSVTLTRIIHFYPIGSVQVFSSIWAGLKSARRAVLCAYWPSSSSLFVRVEWPPSALRFQHSARFGGKLSCLCVNTLKDVLTLIRVWTTIAQCFSKPNKSNVLSTCDAVKPDAVRTQRSPSVCTQGCSARKLPRIPILSSPLHVTVLLSNCPSFPCSLTAAATVTTRPSSPRCLCRTLRAHGSLTPSHSCPSQPRPRATTDTRAEVSLWPSTNRSARPTATALNTDTPSESPSESTSPLLCLGVRIRPFVAGQRMEKGRVKVEDGVMDDF